MNLRLSPSYREDVQYHNFFNTMRTVFMQINTSTTDLCHCLDMFSEWLSLAYRMAYRKLIR